MPIPPQVDDCLRRKTTLMEGSILLVGKPGHLRDGLVSLLSAMPGLPSLVTANSGLLALKVLREAPFRLVLIAGGLPEAEVLELVRQIKAGWPGAGCLVLDETAEGREQALAAGADQVLEVGVPAGRMYAVLKEMLSIEGGSSEM
jgi:DNA-binding NarL/FixJ family response regulator